MTTRQFERNGREWLWPAGDDKLIDVFDEYKDIYDILKYVDNTDVCIQAGGACGVWPYYLGKIFKRVYTFEPDPINFQCLTANAPDAIKCNAALGDGQPLSLKRHPRLPTNAGAWYTRPDVNGFPSIKLDQMDMPYCDLIQLDVEGSEWNALAGAMQLLKRTRPVVVVEEKSLLQGNPTSNTARGLLKSLGYTEVGRVHHDIIFK